MWQLFLSCTILVTFCVLHVQATELCSNYSLALTDGHCDNLSSNLSYFINFCYDNNGTIDGRCCSKNSSSLLGLDLSSCNLQDFTATSVTGLTASLSSQLLLLALAPNNPKFVKLPAPEAFIGDINLQELLMPKSLDCPLGWSVNPHQQSPDLVQCLAPPDPCLSADACPANTSSQCVLTGPGLFACPCQSGWTGYKCMRSDQLFPYTIFGIGWVASTVAVCLIGWLLERRCVGGVIVGGGGGVGGPPVRNDHID